MTAPRAGENTSAPTKSVLVAISTENTPTATAAGPVLRPVTVMLKAPTGIWAPAVAMVIVFAAITEVAMRAKTEDVPTVLTAGVVDVSNQPVGKPRVIVPPIGTAVVVVNVMPTDTFVARAVDEGVTTRLVILVPIPPEAAPADTAVSASVWTVMPVVLPAVAAPIVRPLRVMVKGVRAGILATAVVTTMAVVVVTAEVAVIVATEVVPAALAAGAIDATKNPDGKLRVIFPLAKRAEDVVKLRVTATLFAGTRCPKAMPK